MENSDKKNKKGFKIMLIVLFGLLSIGVGVFLIYNKYFKSDKQNNNTDYMIVYNDTTIPGSKREIRVFKNTVEITTTKYCSVTDCKPSVESKSFNYSDENIKKLKSFMDNNFGKYKLEVNDSDLTERQKEIFQGLFLGEYFFETNFEDYKYKIEYLGDNGIDYDIYLKDDGSILVKKLTINENYDISSVTSYELNFSKENLKLLEEYIEKEAGNSSNSVAYKSNTLKKDEIKIMNSILENNEKLLENIQDEPTLIFSIYYNGIDCPTPELYLFSDNTYELYDKYITKDEKLIPETGTYNYDIMSIIDNIGKYKQNDYGPYIIKDASGKSYTTYNTNNELQEFLNSLGVKLERCSSY